jgi:hypothetical protein
MSDEFAVKATRSLARSSSGHSETLLEKVEHLRGQFPNGLMCFNKCPGNPGVGQTRSVIELKVRGILESNDGL